MKLDDINLDYLYHLIAGCICIVVAFWGDRLGIPSQYVTEAGGMLAATVGHAIGYTPTQVALRSSNTDTNTINTKGD